VSRISYFFLDTPNHLWDNVTRRIMAKGKTNEENVAVKIGDLLSDQRLDLDRVGVYVARTDPSSNYRRLSVIAQSADEEWEIQNGRNNIRS
jgi:hypothetical protein